MILGMNNVIRNNKILSIAMVLLFSIGLFACNKKDIVLIDDDVEENIIVETEEEQAVDKEQTKSDSEEGIITSDTEEDEEKIENIKSTAGYKSKYGVFLSYEGDLSRFADYDEIVIDAQYFTKEQITEYKKGGHKVYSYLNIGSLETFRPYYNEFVDITLSDYENWEEERWIDVSNERWQNYVLYTLAPALIEKGVDGFFVDNCDVYYMYQNDSMLSGVANIMKGLKGYNKAVIMNGGDTFIDAYCSKKGVWSDVITGINQESVFTKIDWEDENHGVSDPEDKAYFTEYLERYSNSGADIYLLEYTKDSSVIADIDSYCKNKKFAYYVSGSIELN
jgi:hypothetical protein